MKVVTVEQMRLAEKNNATLGITEQMLMQNAGAAAFEIIKERQGNMLNNNKCVVLCGSGNNGGDGFVVANLLSKIAGKVTIVLANSIPKTKDAQYNYDICKQTECEIFDADFDMQKCVSAIYNADVIVDAVFGIGFHGSLSEKITTLFNSANFSKGKRFSLDLPSGANGNTGEADKNTFNADITVTFGAAKMGHIILPCKEYCGELAVSDIGIHESSFDGIGTVISSITKNQIPSLLPERKPNSHKGNYGKLLIIAGSKNMSGAAALSTMAALRSGVGLCTLASTKTVIDRIASNIYEPTYITLPENENGGISSQGINTFGKDIEKYDTVCFGMGMGNTDDTKQLLSYILKYAKGTVIIDADGINALSSCIELCKDTEAKVILTPHPGEMSRLTGKSIAEIEANRVKTAKDFATEYNLTLVLKGANTIIASPKGEVYINSTGNSGLSRGGSGDVLTGIIGGLSAQSLTPLVAALTGVFIHGYSADSVADKTSKQGMLPSDVISALPSVFGEFEK